MTETTRLTRLNAEADELEAKIDKLGLFIETAEYRALDMDYRVVLGTRLMAMCSYLSCLNHEILLLNHTSPQGNTDGLTESAEEGC